MSDTGSDTGSETGSGSGSETGSGTDWDPIRALAAALAARTRRTGRRLALILSGDPHWSTAAALGAAAALDTTPACWLSDRTLHPGARPLGEAVRLLGSEHRLLVYDAWSGFDPDGFGAAVGTLCGGGLLLLPCPPLADWPRRTDPQARRIAPWPLGAEAVGGRFIARLVRMLRGDPAVLLVEQDRPLPRLTADPAGRSPTASDAPADLSPDPARPATPDQAAAVAAILALARGRAHRPLVLTAHRGRGKSAALGIGAGRLLAAAVADGHRATDTGQRSAPRTGSGVPKPRLILVTAPRRAAAESLFRHAALAWPAARDTGDGLAAGDAELRFAAPDALAAEGPPAALLLVDEAAGIPAPLLTALLGRYPRSVFATTVHGYEGTGRGFDLRFRATLDRRTPGWRGLTLDTPIRFGADDPLEALAFRALLLDAAPAAAAELEGSGPAPWCVERLDRDALAGDDETLRQAFGLLVLAHYQTRPLDLRLLLDAPGVRVLTLRRAGRIGATLIACTEGGIADPELLQAVYDGRRRPRGHLLPFTLAAHGGLADAPRRRFLRVIRIAVHPALTGRGFGRRLLDELAGAAADEGFDLLGSSFGATPGLLRFWTRCGFRPVQLGTSRNAATGEHALVVLRALTPAARHWRSAASARLAARLPVLLAGPLRRLEPVLAAALLAVLPPIRGLDPHGPWADSTLDAAELVSFARAHRTLEAALPALAALVWRRLGAALRARRVAPDDAALLSAVALQLRPLEELVPRFGARGREALTDTLRGCVARLLAPPGAPRGPAEQARD